MGRGKEGGKGEEEDDGAEVGVEKVEVHKNLGGEGEDTKISIFKIFVGRVVGLRWGEGGFRDGSREQG